MKAQYEIPKDSDIESLVTKIAENFGTDVKTLEDDATRIILAPSRIRIIIRTEKTKFVFRVKGASVEDINFLTSILGEPNHVGQEKLSLNEFVSEVLKIPDVESKSKAEIIEMLNLDEEEFQGYFKQMERFGKRGRGPKPILDVYKILSK